MCTGARAYVIKYILDHVDKYVLMLWLSVVEGIFSAVIAVIWSKADGEEIPSIPDGTVCLAFILIFALSLALSHISLLILLSYLHVSYLVNSVVAIVILLYISQRTFMKMFQPGHGNWEEVLYTGCHVKLPPSFAGPHQGV